MDSRHSLPRAWLVTDERQRDGVLDAVARLPRKSGILLRHYTLSERERRALFDAIRARAPDATILVAGPAALAAEWGADGWHGAGSGAGLRSAPVHNLRELRRAEAQGASVLFVSPIFSTRSHPGARTLGTRRFASLVRQARRPVIALGGMTAAKAPIVMRLGAYGWAGIDAWSG